MENGCLSMDSPQSPAPKHAPAATAPCSSLSCPHAHREPGRLSSNAGRKTPASLSQPPPRGAKADRRSHGRSRPGGPGITSRNHLSSRTTGAARAAAPPDEQQGQARGWRGGTCLKKRAVSMLTPMAANTMAKLLSPWSPSSCQPPNPPLLVQKERLSASVSASVYLCSCLSLPVVPQQLPPPSPPPSLAQWETFCFYHCLCSLSVSPG